MIDTVRPTEREVQDRTGAGISLRLRPYRTADNRIDGAVIVLVDIDEIKRTELELRAERGEVPPAGRGGEGDRHHAARPRRPGDCAGTSAPSASSATGRRRSSASPSSRFLPSEDAAGLAAELAAARGTGPAGEDGWLVRKDGSRFWASAATTALYDDDGRARRLLEDRARHLRAQA